MLTRTTKLRVTKVLQRVILGRKKIIDPKQCRAISVNYALPRPDVELKTLPVRITLGGIAHSVLLGELLKLYVFQRRVATAARRMTASYLFKGARFLHLGF